MNSLFNAGGDILMNPEVSLAYIGTFENIATNLSQRSVALNGKTYCRSTSKQCFFLFASVHSTCSREAKKIFQHYRVFFSEKYSFLLLTSTETTAPSH